MRRRRNGYRKSVRWEPERYFFRSRPIDYTSHGFDVRYALIHDFFTADDQRKQQLFAAYGVKHGPIALAYMQREYDGWRSGSSTITEMLQERLHELVASELSGDLKFGFGLFEFMRAIREVEHEFEKRWLEIWRNNHGPLPVNLWYDGLTKAFVAIERLTIPGPMQSYRPLDAQEKADALSTAKYLLRMKLYHREQHVRHDLSVLLPYVSRICALGATLQYSATDFGVNLDLSAAPTQLSQEVMSRPSLEAPLSTYREYASEHVAAELTRMHSAANRNRGSAIMCVEDMNMLLRHIDDLLRTSNESEVSSSLRGEGGVLSVKLKLTPARVARAALVKASMRLSIWLALIITLISVLVRVRLWGILVFAVPFGLPPFYGAVSEHVHQIRKSLKSLKVHGRQ